MCVDLHTHSIYSDGTATPAELVRMAVERGLTAIALTDHDTADGVVECLSHGRAAGLVVIPGIEISAIHEKHHVHILGYGIDPTDADLGNWLTRIQESRMQRNRQIIGNLNAMGFDLDFAELTTISPDGQTGRPHIARLMVEKRMITSVDQAFRRLLARGRPAYAERFIYSAAETIAMIHRAGGLAVLAHPGQLDSAFRVQPRIVRELTLRGLDGVEVYYPTHSAKMQRKLKELAARHALLVTGGSDYHDSTRSGHGMASGGAHCPPDSIMTPLRSHLNDRYFFTNLQ